MEQSDPQVDPRSSIFDLQSLEVGRRSLARCFSEIEHRLKRFDEELMHLRRGYYAPEIRAASLLLQQATGESPITPIPHLIPLPLSILVVVEPSAAGIPHPHVSHGRLLEAFIPLSDSSRSALEAALRIRDQAIVPSVTIQVVAVGARGLASVLREALSLGADRVCLIQPDCEAVAPASAAAALAAVLGPDPGFELILGGETRDDQEEGLSARLLAQALDIPFTGSASQLLVEADTSTRRILQMDSDGKPQGWRALPTAVAVDKSLPLREFTTTEYLAALDKSVELIRWPRKVETRSVELTERLQLPDSTNAPSVVSAGPLAPDQAAIQLLQELGLARMSAPLAAFQGSIEDVANPTLLGATRSRVVGVIAADAAGRLRPSAASILQAVRLMATAMRAELVTLLIAPAEESLQRQVVAQCLALGRWDIVLLTTSASASSGEIGGQMLVDCWPDPVAPPRAIVGESWTEMAFAALAGRQRKSEMLALRIRQVKMDQGKIILVSSRAGGKLQTQFTLDLRSGAAPWISLIDVAEIAPAPETNLPRTVDGSAGPPVVQRWAARPVSAKTDVWEGLLAEVKQELGVARLADADFIVDVGFGVGNRDGYEAVIDPLLQSLQELGVRSLAIGGSRKVTEELHLLSADRQIGQTGVSVNPHILLAIGISGAPQHLNYIGPRATILAFNRDSEAPIMTLNRRQASPRVFPIIGDLFETVPAFIAALGNETPIGSDRPPEIAEEGK